MNANEIRMFAAATEIQDQWTPHLCDRVCLKKTSVPKVDYVVWETLEKFDSKYIRKWCTWLPYPYQMLQRLDGGSGSALLFGTLYLDFIYPEQRGHNSSVACAIGEYRRKMFRSIETTILGLVMSVQHNKYWWNGEWCKRIE